MPEPKSHPRTLWAVLRQGWNEETARLEEAIGIATRQYAKRQRTWFRHQHPGTDFLAAASDFRASSLPVPEPSP